HARRIARAGGGLPGQRRRLTGKIPEAARGDSPDPTKLVRPLSRRKSSRPIGRRARSSWISDGSAPLWHVPRRGRPPFRLTMRPRSLLLLRVGTAALLLAAVAGLAHRQPDSVAGQVARSVGDVALRAVEYARGVPRADPTTTALNPKVVRATASYSADPAGPVAPGETSTVPVSLRNQGDDTWETAGAHAVRLSYHVYDAS